MTQEYEVYREKVRITEWRDGAVFRTESLGSGWFTEAEIKANDDRNIQYVTPSDKDPNKPVLGIRVKR